MVGWPFGDLVRGSAGVVLADPPWHFKRYSEVVRGRGKAPQDHYDTMNQDEMKALPVSDLCAADCVLIMWVTAPHLKMGLELVEAWGFEYKTIAFSWLKAEVSSLDLFPFPKDANMGMGYWTRSNGEISLLGTRGKPKRLDAGVRMGIIEPAREHSRKPNCVYGRIERLVAGPYVELFARTRRPGWSSWGNDVGKFRPALAAKNPSEA